MKLVWDFWGVLLGVCLMFWVFLVFVFCGFFGWLFSGGCQLSYTNMLAAAGRSLAKNPVCIYLEVHLRIRGFPGNCICPLYAVKSTGFHFLAH